KRADLSWRRWCSNPFFSKHKPPLPMSQHPRDKRLFCKTLTSSLMRTTYPLLRMATPMARSATKKTPRVPAPASLTTAVSTSASISLTGVCPRSLLLSYVNRFRVSKMITRLLPPTSPLPWEVKTEFLLLCHAGMLSAL
ncbi:hypothetical protein NW757_014618, partial [Fusarium falciforme]